MTKQSIDTVALHKQMDQELAAKVNIPPIAAVVNAKIPTRVVSTPTENPKVRKETLVVRK